MSQNWKRAEKKAAELFGGKRNISRGSNFSQSEPDVIDSGDFIVECKYRKTLPKFATAVLAQAASYDKKKTPVGYLKERGKHRGIVFMYDDDFEEWFGSIIKKHNDTTDA